MAGATLVDDREAPCSGPLAKAEEEIPAQEVAPETKHGTETAVRSDTDVGEGGGGGGGGGVRIQ